MHCVVRGGCEIYVPNYLDRREMSFTLADDVYIRYQSFKDAEEFQQELKKKCPHKIDIGAVYNHKPKERNSVAVFQPQEKELVFDIDMTDYDDVRTCCSGADICHKCWKFMTIAIKCIDDTLRKDFGFHHLLWVYSGRRGVHCWVCDAAARRLSQQARGAVAEYLQLIKGGQNQAKKVSIGAQMHPMVERSVKTCRQYFRTVCLDEQDIFASTEQHTTLLKLIPDDATRKELATSFLKLKTSKDKWEELEGVFTRNLHSGKLSRSTSPRLLEEIILQYTYPRLDIEVTKGLNHLLKAPFCVHPKTGRVCVPMEARAADKFDPMAVPTVSQLESELNEALKNQEAPPADVSQPMLTSLKPAMQLFNKFLAGLDRERSTVNKKDDPMEW
ncbi:DNA primase small subunit-like isoform X1 [Amphibalanus amphitrite]|uniref:DNA primase small subunit-like isoform X1 n=1 Tax=Amphibalanus amphitrite TaxID=1232801 RepID=UPI001C910177|nr:DNA primase small subunit-like isoform X1 [Amphibalanus amphitrite]XP_043230131.1 DNA primase small subunit-like isoform X1 [Amphibalanus amphitrite]